MPIASPTTHNGLTLGALHYFEKGNTPCLILPLKLFTKLAHTQLISDLFRSVNLSILGRCQAITQQYEVCQQCPIAALKECL